eukprot:jgi/Botrbrau1/16695/Bobra.0267s0011.1
MKGPLEEYEEGSVAFSITPAKVPDRATGFGNAWYPLQSTLMVVTPSRALPDYAQLRSLRLPSASSPFQTGAVGESSPLTPEAHAGSGSGPEDEAEADPELSCSCSDNNVLLHSDGLHSLKERPILAMYTVSVHRAWGFTRCGTSGDVAGVLAVYGRTAGGEWEPGDHRIAFSLIVPQAPDSEGLRMIDFETPAYLTRERGTFAQLGPTFIPLPMYVGRPGIPVKVPKKASLMSRLSRSLSLSSSSRSSSLKS